MGVCPEDTARRGVESKNVVRGLNRVHDAVHNKRRGLKFFEGSSLGDPLNFEVLYILGGDLREGAVSLAVVVSMMSEPVLRLLTGAKNTLI